MSCSETKTHISWIFGLLICKLGQPGRVGPTSDYETSVCVFNRCILKCLAMKDSYSHEVHFFGMLMTVYVNWVFLLGGLALLEWVIYQAKFIPTSHYETLNLGKLLHILQKRLGIKREEGGSITRPHNT